MVKSKSPKRGRSKSPRRGRSKSPRRRSPSNLRSHSPGRYLRPRGWYNAPAANRAGCYLTCRKKYPPSISEYQQFVAENIHKFGSGKDAMKKVAALWKSRK